MGKPKQSTHIVFRPTAALLIALDWLSKRMWRWAVGPLVFVFLTGASELLAKNPAVEGDIVRIVGLVLAILGAYFATQWAIQQPIEPDDLHS